MKTNFLRTCPNTGGCCMNPLCMFGCIENTIVVKEKIKKKTKAEQMETIKP